MRGQLRPAYRPFRLFCLAFACLYLLVAGLSLNASFGIVSKTARPVVQKAAGSSVLAKERDCRKRASAGKTVLLDGSAADMPGLPSESVDVPGCRSPQGGEAFALSFPKTGLERTSGARAPPTVRV